MLEAVLLNERKMPPPLLQLGTELKSLTARDAGLIPGRGTKIPHASQGGQKKKKSSARLLYIRTLYKYLFHSCVLAIVGKLNSKKYYLQ